MLLTNAEVFQFVGLAAKSYSVFSRSSLAQSVEDRITSEDFRMAWKVLREEKKIVKNASSSEDCGFRWEETKEKIDEDLLASVTGWPCHSFFNAPLYRRISLGRDVRITNLGITLRIRKAGKLTYKYFSWEQLFQMRKRKEKR